MKRSGKIAASVAGIAVVGGSFAAGYAIGNSGESDHSLTPFEQMSNEEIVDVMVDGAKFLSHATYEACLEQILGESITVDASDINSIEDAIDERIDDHEACVNGNASDKLDNVVTSIQDLQAGYEAPELDITITPATEGDK